MWIDYFAANSYRKLLDYFEGGRKYSKRTWLQHFDEWYELEGIETWLIATDNEQSCSLYWLITIAINIVARVIPTPFPSTGTEIDNLWLEFKDVI